MLTFPNAKLNLGLNVIEQRDDGFHNIESVMIPIPMHDSLEIVEDMDGVSGQCDLEVVGFEIEGDISDNLCCKAYRMVAENYDLPAVKVRLLKNIPIGAGLGGGSANAAFTVKLLNRLFQLNISAEEMQNHCAALGSDCSFFVGNEIAMASGRGENLEAFNLNLKGYHLVIVHPGVHINTGTAYSAITPDPSKKGMLAELLNMPIGEWKDNVTNAFEARTFEDHPELGAIKAKLYEEGALYASMTGSGSSIYGLFSEGRKPDLRSVSAEVWSAKMS